MMSVEEYALDVNKTVSEILKQCKRLNIEAIDGDSMLDEEAITELDNTIAQEEDYYKDELIEKEEEKIEEIVNSSKPKKQINNTNKVASSNIANKEVELAMASARIDFTKKASFMGALNFLNSQASIALIKNKGLIIRV